MAYSWTENGPVSLPPRSIAYGVGALLLVLAVAGVGLGYRAALRQSGAPGLDDASASADGTLIAKPIVDLPPAVTAPEPAKDDKKADADADKAKADALARQLAAAQAIQAKPSKTAGDIDDILTSPSEKPPAPAKAPDEAPPPGPPVKSDVPF